MLLGKCTSILIKALFPASRFKTFLLVGYCRVKLLHRHEEACKREGEKREQIMEKI